MSNTIYNNNNSLQEALRLLRDKATPAGPDTSDATASAEAILDGEIAYNAEGRVIGTMPNHGDISQTMNGIDTQSITIEPGYTSGGIIALDDTINNAVTEQTELLSSLRSKIENLSSEEGVDASDVTAIAENILEGKTAYIAGGKVTGTMPTQDGTTIVPSAEDQVAIPAQHYALDQIIIQGDANLQPENIKSGTNIFGVEGTYLGPEDPFHIERDWTYNVSDIEGAKYGFELNINGYYESKNKGVHSSYAICRVQVNVINTSDIVFDVINYAESTYDYAIFGLIDTPLQLNSSADSTYHYNFQGQSTPGVRNVTYPTVSPGTHFIDVKFIKDTSQNSGHDSVQFKLNASSSQFPPETLAKILQAEPALIPSNIKKGVSICGVEGTLNTDASNYENAILTRTLTSYENSYITSIPSYGFYLQSRLNTLSCPNCTRIEEHGCRAAFYLSSIYAPRCLTIGAYAFAQAGLTELNFPNCTTVGSVAFSSCGNLVVAELPQCQILGSYAFAQCSRLQSVYLPVCSSMGSNAFWLCSALRTIYAPQCSRIDSSAFKGCINLQSVDVPLCQSCPSYLFEQCGQLSSIALPACVRCETGCFSYCSNLTYVSLPVCNYIGTRAFNTCKNLEFIALPRCSRVDAFAFASCSKLSHIILGQDLDPTSVYSTYLNSGAFQGCSALSTIELHYNYVPTVYSNTFQSTPIDNSSYTGTWGSIYVPASLLTVYKTTSAWLPYAERITSLNPVTNGENNNE